MNHAINLMEPIIYVATQLQFSKILGRIASLILNARHKSVVQEMQKVIPITRFLIANVPLFLMAKFAKSIKIALMAPGK